MRTVKKIEVSLSLSVVWSRVWDQVTSSPYMVAISSRLEGLHYTPYPPAVL